MFGLLFGVVCLTTSTVEDFFPTLPGTKWTYEESTESKYQYTNETLAPFDILGSATIPIVTKRKSDVLGTNYYRIEGNTVFLFACEKERGLVDPVPFLKSAPTVIKWSFKGRTPVGQALLPIDLKAVSSPNGKIKVLGEERDSMKQIVDARIEEAGGLVTIKTHSEAIYAKGIGMVEMTETVAYTKTKSTRKVKLVSFELPK